MTIQNSFWSLLLCCLPSLLPAAAAQIELTGRVVNETDAPVSGANVTVRPVAGAAVPEVSSWQTQSEPTGAFTIELPQTRPVSGDG